MVEWVRYACAKLSDDLAGRGMSFLRGRPYAYKRKYRKGATANTNIEHTEGYTSLNHKHTQVQTYMHIYVLPKRHPHSDAHPCIDTNK